MQKDKSLFTTKTGYGLPIGNLTSQVFANFYLTEFDQFLKEELGLTLHPKKIYLQSAKIGVPFLGAYIKPNYIMAGKRVLKNFMQKARGYEKLSKHFRIEKSAIKIEKKK